MIPSSLSDFLAQCQIFTTEEAQNALETDKNNSTLKNLLSYHIKKGHIIRIRRGIYYVVPKGIEPDKCPVDPYLLCSKLAPDAILAYHTALAFYGKLYSVRNDFVYLTCQKVKAPFSFRNEIYKGVSPPEKLSEPKKNDFGVQVEHHFSHEVRIISLERTFVDLLDRPAITGNWEEIWRCLENIEYLEFDAVFTYLQILDNSTTTAKVGCFLEAHQDSLMVPEGVLESLEKHLPSQPHYLDRNHQSTQKLMKRWNLIVPESLIERKWEEPHEDI